MCFLISPSLLFLSLSLCVCIDRYIHNIKHFSLTHGGSIKQNKYIEFNGYILGLFGKSTVISNIFQRYRPGSSKV